MAEKLIFATSNQGKLREIRSILGDLGLEVISMAQAGFHDEIEENGTTFAQNAAIKARAVWNQTGGLVLADDSGLVIDYLNGEPGVYSARYMGRSLLGEKPRPDSADGAGRRRGEKRPLCLRNRRRTAGWQGNRHRGLYGRTNRS